METLLNRVKCKLIVVLFIMDEQKKIRFYYQFLQSYSDLFYLSRSLTEKFGRFVGNKKHEHLNRMKNTARVNA